jgi:DNA-directed RNA polymerase subunit K/omega
MTDIKSKVQGIEANCQARNIADFAGPTKNIYEAIAIINKRASNLAVDIKEELHSKLAEFAVQTDTIEEIHENKEQIEISKFYERMPNPALIATNEFLEKQLEYRYKGDEQEKEATLEEETPDAE